MKHDIITTIEIPNEIVKRLELLHYDYLALSSLIETLNGVGSSFERIMTQYKQEYTEWMRLREQMRKEFIPEKYQTNQYDYNLNYDTGILEIFANENT